MTDKQNAGSPALTAAAGEERKVVTVIFADLVGSTELGEHDPERTRALLERFYDAMHAEIDEAGGTVEKFVGDAVMAAFGAPVAYEDHSERALHAALSMRSRLEELFGEALRLRIGAATGEVVVGRAREGSSFVTGDAVNVAARLEQAAPPGEILVAERTAAAARGAFEFADLTTVEAKGKKGGVACRRLVRALSLTRPRGVGELRSVFVGRGAELRRLIAAYEDVVNEHTPHLVTVVGDAGVGKTSLAREFWTWLGTRSPQPLRRSGRCLPYGHSITYWPLREILKEHLGLLESDPSEAVLARLGRRAILALTLGLDAVSDVHPLAARDRLHDAWVDLAEEMSASRPAVLLVEDLHRADNDLLDLLERMVRDVRGPMLLLATARPELFDLRPGWGGARRPATTLELEPLSVDETERMLAELLAAEVPALVRELVVERGEGNPFFVEELLATLIDQGVLDCADGTWKVREPAPAFAMPDSVQAVLAARIDLLPPAEKAALQAASVIGRVFWAGPVYDLAHEDDVDLRVLEDRDFVRRCSTSSIAGETEFTIKHQLTRAAAYAGLPKAKRARLHAEFAAWLERFGDGRDEHAPLLAHHYAEAVGPEEVDLLWPGQQDEVERLRGLALAWLRRAADLAVARYAIDEALGLLQRAVSLEPSQSDQVELWQAIGRASVLKFDGEAFWTAMVRAADLCRDRETLADVYADLAIQTTTRSGMWKGRPADAVLDGWIERALDLAPAESAARAKALAARSYLDPKANDAAREAFEIAEGLADVELRSFAIDGLTATASAAGEYKKACEWAELRLSIAQGINDPDHRAEAYLSAICAYLAVGRISEARGLARALAEVSAELTPHHRLHAVAFALLVDVLAGRWTSIRDAAPQAEQTVAANKDTPCVLNAWTFLVCATAHAHATNFEEARRLEKSADAVALQTRSDMVLAAKIGLALARKDLGAVTELLPAEPPPTGGRPPIDVEVLSSRLDALAALGDRERVDAEAPSLLKPGTYFEPFALRALGVVREDAELLGEAVARFETIGLGWHAEQTRALLPAARTP